MTEPTEALFVAGHCDCGAIYCGAIGFEVRIPAGERPIFTAYCHCDSCRRAHAAPLYPVVCVEESMLALTSGAEALVAYQKPGASIVRAFCGVCGSRVLNRFPGGSPGGRVPVAFFPDLLRESDQRALPRALRPAKHNRPEECVLDEEMLRRLFGDAAWLRRALDPNHEHRGFSRRAPADREAARSPGSTNASQSRAGCVSHPDHADRLSPGNPGRRVSRMNPGAGAGSS